MLSLFSAFGGTLKILIMKICIFPFIFSSPESIFIVSTAEKCRMSGMGEESCFLSDVFNSMNLLIF